MIICVVCGTGLIPRSKENVAGESVGLMLLWVELVEGWGGGEDAVDEGGHWGCGNWRTETGRPTNWPSLKNVEESVEAILAEVGP